MHFEIRDDSLVDLYIQFKDREIADFFRFPQNKDAIVDCIRIGVTAMQYAKQGQDAEYLKRQLEAAVHSVELSLSKLPEQVKQSIMTEVGSNGKVLAPLTTAVSQASAVSIERINELKTLLTSDLDPKSSASVLGKALADIRQILDPRWEGSIYKSVEKALTEIAKADSNIVLAVERSISKPLADIGTKVDQLSLEVRGISAAQEIIDQTALKGKDFEEEVVERLQVWAGIHGAEVTHTGHDNKTGDAVIVDLGGDIPITIVVECKNDTSLKGRKRISDILTDAMSIRNADAAILVSKSQEGLAREIGDWAQGHTDRGPWIATTYENLTTAVVFVLAMVRIDAAKKMTKGLDTQSIRAQLERIRTSLKRIKNVSDKGTTIQGAVDDIKSETKGLKTDIEDAVAQIESSLRNQ